MTCFVRLRFLVLQVIFALWNTQDGAATFSITTDLDDIGNSPSLGSLRLPTSDAYQLLLIGSNFDTRGPKAGTAFDYDLQKEPAVTPWTGLGADMTCFVRLRFLVLQPRLDPRCGNPNEPWRTLRLGSRALATPEESTPEKGERQEPLEDDGRAPGSSGAAGADSAPSLGGGGGAHLTPRHAANCRGLGSRFGETLRGRTV
ncbi:hypothetical protein HPB47_023676 [Ixodes persulcatus]|uniref:Uncharacterized protein n=1 Tax=Ixodes persulcatus TaxID=34615 RepID=A0AC60Q682_IXOPE|nr:hypothetical protein HPB47_023676 [Ixodes persulcatus]